VVVKELEDKLHEAVADLQVVSQGMKPPEAWRAFGDQTLEGFWQSWPGVRAWGEWLWTLIDNERGDRAAPVAPDAEHEETGGGG
jgi:hypothetical protein